MTMHPAIREALDKVEKTTSEYREIMHREQERCLHQRVIHSEWAPSEFGPLFKARRLCLHCGLEEEAMGSGWGDGDHDFRKLKTDGFHRVVTQSDLYAARFPKD